jgi:hypothetical protein
LGWVAGVLEGGELGRCPRVPLEVTVIVPVIQGWIEQKY